MRGAFLLHLVLSALLSTGFGLVAQEQPEPLQVTGVVVDEAGRPVAGIMVGCQWYVQEDRVFPLLRADTTSEGRFFLDLYGGLQKGAAILALDRAGGRAGLAVFLPSRAGAQLTIRLEPIGRMRGEIRCPELNEIPRHFQVVTFLKPGGSFVMSSISRTGSFEFPLPLGDYHVQFHSEEFEREIWEFSLTPGRREVERTDLTVKPNVLARHFDKAPPEWKVTHAQGAPADVKPADFLGRYVLVLFWRRESGESGIDGLTKLHSLHVEFRDVSESFALLGFHLGEATSLEDLLAKLGDADFRFT